MFNLSKPLRKVNGILIDFKTYRLGGDGYYPSAKVLVKIGGHHPYVIWTAADPSKDGADPYFYSGKYFKDYEEAQAAFSAL